MNKILTVTNALCAAALVMLLIASTYKLSEAPAIWYDEGFYSQIAMNFSTVGKQLLQTAPNTYEETSYITVGYPLVAPVALSYKLFGTGVLQGRAVMALFIIGFALLSYLFISNQSGKKEAAWTLLLLASFPMLYGNGKPILGEVPGLFYFMLSLLSLFKLEESGFRSTTWYVLAGLTVGLCVVTKPFYLLLLGALFLTLLIKWQNISLKPMGVALGVGAFAAAFALWVALQFGSDASLGSVLADYANPYSIQNIWAQMAHNALRLVTEMTPLYTLMLISAWAVSLFLRRKSMIYSAEIAAFIFCILTLAQYLRIEGWYRYLFPAASVALVFFAPALFTMFGQVSKKFVYVKFAPYVILLLLIGTQVYQTAHASYVAQYYNATRTKDMSEYLSTLKDKSIFLYNAPELAILLPSANYYQYLSPSQVIIGVDTLAELTRRIPDEVILPDVLYSESDPRFSGYSLSAHIDRYAVLEKK